MEILEEPWIGAGGDPRKVDCKIAAISCGNNGFEFTNHATAEKLLEKMEFCHKLS
jgi:hypothetical protein